MFNLIYNTCATHEPGGVVNVANTDGMPMSRALVLEMLVLVVLYLYCIFRCCIATENESKQNELKR